MRVKLKKLNVVNSTLENRGPENVSRDKTRKGIKFFCDVLKSKIFLGDSLPPLENNIY